jgi:hypothetical protein
MERRYFFQVPPLSTRFLMARKKSGIARRCIYDWIDCGTLSPLST